MAINYVKFMRGTQTLYDSLVTKDQDTLYFVYEAANSEVGKLYLGNKLISGSNSNPSGSISLGDVADILLDQNIEDGDLLVYDEAEGKWVNQSVAEALNVPVMQGATASSNGIAGLVPVPVAGEQNKFLRGDGTWVTISGGMSDEERESIQNLQSVVEVLVGDDEDKSIREIIAEEVAELLIPDNPKADLDTLQEIAQWIQDHPDDASQINSDIIDLQARVENLEDVLNGDENTDGLADRVATLEATIGEFIPVQDSYLDVSSAISYLNANVTEINDRLRWHELAQS